MSHAKKLTISAFHHGRGKLEAFHKRYSSDGNIFLVSQIFITKEINKCDFFIVDSIIKKLPRGPDVSHKTNRISKSNLGPWEKKTSN